MSSAWDVDISTSCWHSFAVVRILSSVAADSVLKAACCIVIIFDILSFLMLLRTRKATIRSRRNDTRSMRAPNNSIWESICIRDL